MVHGQTGTRAGGVPRGIGKRGEVGAIRERKREGERQGEREAERGREAEKGRERDR